MPWKQRGSNRYYYRSVRDGGHVRSEYIGAGARADLFAELDQLDRERRQQEAIERQIARSQFDELGGAPPELTMLLAEARSEVARALVEAGYHQHKRQWRKRRAKKEAS